MRITIECNDLTEFDAVIAKFTAKQSIAAGTTQTKTETPKDSTPKETSKPKEETKSDVAELSYAKDVAPAILKMAEAKGRDAVKEMFKAFNVTSGPQLKADQYAGIIKAVDNAMLA